MDIPKETNLLYFPAYYLLPEQLLKKSKRCKDLPRNPKAALENKDCQEVINIPDFRYLVKEGITFLAWPHIGVYDPISAFTKDDPLYVWIHDTIPILQRLKAQGYSLEHIQD